MSSGANFMLGKFAGAPKKQGRKVDFAPPDDVTPAQIDDVVTLLNDGAKTGKKIAEGLKHAVAALDHLAECGLTPEALVLLICDQCPKDRAGRATTVDTVERVMQGFFRLGNHLR